MAYNMKGFGGFKDIDSRLGDNAGLDKNNVKKIEKGIKNFSDKEKKGVVDRNLTNFHYRNSIGSSGADSVQAVLNTYQKQKNAPAKMKKKSSTYGAVSATAEKMGKKKIKKVSFKPSLSKPKSDGLVPMGKGGTMNHIKSLQKMEKQATTGMEKAKIRESIATARKEYNKPIYNQEKSSPAKKRGLWDNIHAKRRRGETMRKKGADGAPTEEAIKNSQSPVKLDKGTRNKIANTKLKDVPSKAKKVIKKAISKTPTIRLLKKLKNTLDSRKSIKGTAKNMGMKTVDKKKKTTTKSKDGAGEKYGRYTAQKLKKVTSPKKGKLTKAVTKKANATFKKTKIKKELSMKAPYKKPTGPRAK